MTIKVYGMVSNNGDGSGSMHWFLDGDLVDRIVDEDPETWGGNDCGADIYTFPDGFDFAAAGFSFSDDDVRDELDLNSDQDDDEQDDSDDGPHYEYAPDEPLIPQPVPCLIYPTDDVAKTGDWAEAFTSTGGEDPLK